MKESKPKYQELTVGLVRLHILHHASVSTVYGLGIIQELSRHGYLLGPGTVYPLLRSMERRGWLKSTTTRNGGRRPRVLFSATVEGRVALKKARGKVRELYEEMFNILS